MFIITLDELRLLSKEQISILKENADKGDVLSQCKLSLCILFRQVRQESKSSILHYLNSAADQSESLANLLLGYIHEHAIGVPKNYSKAVEFYSKAYDGIILTDRSSINDFLDIKQKRGAEECYKILADQIDRLITTKGLCVYEKGEFLFDWTKGVRDVVAESLPSLNQAVSNLNALSLESSAEDYPGRWEYRIQDKLYMPVEILKTAVARDYLEKYLTDGGFPVLPHDKYFNNALGRCLIDDDDAYDNDYIIGGILLFAGHDDSPLWQYRAGLWYEFNDDSLDPKAAVYWYEKAQKRISSATDALKRVKESVQYNVLNNGKSGNIEDCQLLLNRTAKNRHNSVTWLVEGACRGDGVAGLRLEQQLISTKGKDSVFGSPLSASERPFYEILEKEKEADNRVVAGYLTKMAIAKYREQKKTSSQKSELQLQTTIEQQKKSVRNGETSMTSIDNLEKKYHDLTKKWQEDGLSKSNDIIKQLKAAETKFKASMADVEQKWWHILFCERTYSVEKCISIELRNGKDKIDAFKKASSEIMHIADKLAKEFLGNDIASKPKVTKTQKMLREFNSAITSGLSCIDSIKTQISRLKDGRAVRMAEPEFSWSKTLFLSFSVWGLISFIVVLATGGGYGSLLISFGSVGAVLLVKINDETNFKNIAVGFMIGVAAALVILLVGAFLK